MIVLRTKAVDETRAVGAALADLARPGDVVLLAGDLGAGKTALAQGFAAGLGVAEPVTSPTFVLARQYHGRLLFHHLDVYRLDQLEEVHDLGLPELLDEGGVALIEWGDMVAPALIADYLEVRLTLGPADDDRQLDMQVVGPSWGPRWRVLRDALARWVVEPC